MEEADNSQSFSGKIEVIVTYDRSRSPKFAPLTFQGERLITKRFSLRSLLNGKARDYRYFLIMEIRMENTYINDN